MLWAIAGGTGLAQERITKVGNVTGGQTDQEDCIDRAGAPPGECREGQKEDFDPEVSIGISAYWARLKLVRQDANGVSDTEHLRNVNLQFAFPEISLAFPGSLWFIDFAQFELDHSDTGGRTFLAGNYFIAGLKIDVLGAYFGNGNAASPDGFHGHKFGFQGGFGLLTFRGFIKGEPIERFTAAPGLSFPGVGKIFSGVQAFYEYKPPAARYFFRLARGRLGGLPFDDRPTLGNGYRFEKFFFLKATAGLIF
ncbi:MAG: hypothetical protein O7B79_12625 [SAR324 cluster bacterium]|nr:hypothetical protein [SAR324 cluster bacterium]